MNAKSFFIGLAAGIATATLLQKPISNSIYNKPENVLHKVKSLFKQDGPISGSWIEMKAQDFTKGPVVYSAYKGGISRVVDNHTEQWEFIADANTGVIIDVRQV